MSMIKNLINISLISMVCYGSLQANETQKNETKENIKLKLQIKSIKDYGHSLKENLYLKEYPFLKIESVKTIYSINTKEPKILLSIKNNANFPVSLEKIFNLKTVKPIKLNPNEKENVILTEKIFKKYLTKVSNEEYYKINTKIKNLEHDLKVSEKENSILISKNSNLNIKKNQLKLKEKELQVNFIILEKELTKIIYKYDLPSIKLAKIAITGNENTELGIISIEKKIAMLKFLMDNQQTQLTKYKISPKEEELKKEIDLITINNDILTKKIEKEKIYIEELKNILKNKSITKETEVLKNTVKKIEELKSNILLLKNQIEKKEQKIFSLKEIIKLKDQKLRKNKVYIEELEKENKNNLKINLTNKNLKADLKKLREEYNILKEKNTLIMTENKELFEKYTKANIHYEETIKKNFELKAKIKKLQDLL